MNHTISGQTPPPSELAEQLSQALESALSGQVEDQLRPRGRPRVLCESYLWVSLLLCLLGGMHSYQDWWRWLRRPALGSFPPLALTDDALVKRLRQAGVEPVRQLFRLVSQALAQSLAGYSSTQLAPFASQILALDECTLDRLSHHLPLLRRVPAGDPRLLAGKLVALFNIRTQQWQRLRYVRNALAQGAWLALPLLAQVPIGSLLLFDLGYFNFAWFDYLGERQLWWVSRWRSDTTYQLVHTFYRQQEVLDALVWLGSSHGSRAARLCRLVRFGDGKQVRCYVTNVLDPHLLSMPDLAQLYARRWDIELAFLTLKEYLDLHHWWSGQPVLIEQQLWLVLILAQVYQAWRLRLAVQEHVDVFDVSLPLLIHYVPLLIRQGEAIGPWMQTQGKALGLVRANQRLQVQVPSPALEDYHWPSRPVSLSRRARYQPAKPRPPRPSGAYWRRLKREREQQQQRASPLQL